MGILCCIAEKYDYVGKLLRPGEEPTEYTDTEEEQHDQSKQDDSADKPKSD